MSVTSSVVAPPCLLCIPWSTFRRVRGGKVDRGVVEGIARDTVKRHPTAEAAVELFLSLVTSEHVTSLAPAAEPTN